MAANITRYLIENEGADETTFRLAIIESKTICHQLGLSRITLLVPAIGNISGSIVESNFGKDITKKLCNGESYKLNGIMIDLLSPRQKRFSFNTSYETVIAMHLSLDVIDAIELAAALVFLPWSEKEGKDWLSTCNPVILGKNAWQVQQVNLDPYVVAALNSLTSTINLSSGLLHSMDKKTTKVTLSTIKEAGHQPDPEDLRKWAMQNNWSSSGADALKKMAERKFK